MVDDNDENESVIIDCQLVEFLKDEILSQSTNVPREFIMRVVVLLNRGSVLSTTSASTMPNYPYNSGGMCVLKINTYKMIKVIKQLKRILILLFFRIKSIFLFMSGFMVM